MSTTTNLGDHRFNYLHVGVKATQGVDVRRFEMLLLCVSYGAHGDRGIADRLRGRNSYVKEPCWHPYFFGSIMTFPFHSILM